MIENIINNIMDAEAEAEEILKKATVKAKETLIKAKEDSQKIIKDAEIEIEAKIKKAKEEAQAEADVIYKELVENGKKDAHKLIEDVKNKTDEVIDFIAGRLLDEYGNS